MSVAWNLYRAAAPVLGALAPAARAFVSPHERALWNERLGYIDAPEPCEAWIHAASLGEALAVAPLARELRAAQPSARLRLTATTRTGRTRLAALGLPVSLAPLDAPQAVGRFLAGTRPRRVFLIETELWPHWLMRARDSGLPVTVVSARLSERSVQRYRRLGAEFRALIAGLAGVLTQSAEDQSRWLLLGAQPERTSVVGNLKSDALPAPVDDRGAARAALELDPTRPLLVLGSLRPGEARIAARAWRLVPEHVRELWQVVAVPRHARAGDDLRAEARTVGVAAAPPGPPHGDAWRWDDRVGVLADYYAAAEVAVVGGSFLQYGGHNPLEPAACGAAVIMGPHHASQIAGVRALREHDAIWIAGDARGLAEALTSLLDDAEVRGPRGTLARQVVESERGAARRAVAQLAAWRLWPAT